jgi:RAB protein geranylgeranyltransferase component A
MNLFLQKRLTRFLNWILYYSDDIQNANGLYQEIREIKYHLKQLEKAEKERAIKESKDQRI